MTERAASATGGGDGILRAGRSAWLRLLGVLFRPASLALFGLIVGSAIPLDWLTNGPALCPFKLSTGLPCPGCGLTRSAVALLHGDPTASVFYHPLGAPLVIVVVLIGIVDVWVWWQSRRSGEAPSAPFWLLERLFRTPAPWVAIGALLVVWLVRLPLYVAGAWTF